MTRETDRELLKDIEAHLRDMWDKRLLPASCWPVDLARRLTATLEAKQVEGDYLEGVNIPNLREALIFLGRNNGVGEGEVGENLAKYVNAIVSGVLAKK